MFFSQFTEFSSEYYYGNNIISAKMQRFSHVHIHNDISVNFMERVKKFWIVTNSFI